MNKVSVTNDHATFSKVSAELRGYLGDKKYSHDLVGTNFVSRSPLINIGYTIRVEMIRYYLRFIIENSKNGNLKSKFRIFSLGAGFDNTYHWLIDEFNEIDLNFIEIDVDSVVSEKLDKYSSSYGYSPTILTDQVYVLNGNLFLISLDLYHIDRLGHMLDLVDDTFLNIWLSECALCYLDLNGSNNVISFVSSVPNSYFLLFEQLMRFPLDPFSKVMTKHFENNQAPILSPLQIDGESSQYSRFSKYFLNINISFMSQFFYENFAKLKKIFSIQHFDEWEELDLFLIHYALTLADNTTLTIIPSTPPRKETSASIDFPLFLNAVDKSTLPTHNSKSYSTCNNNGIRFLSGGRFSLNEVMSCLITFKGEEPLSQQEHPEFSRFRHSSVIFKDKLIIIGGIKKLATKSFFILDLITLKEETFELEDDYYFDRILHSSAANNEFIYVMGGISVTTKIPLPHLRIELSSRKVDIFEPKHNFEILPPLRYHSCAMIDENTLIIVGGLTGQSKLIMSDCFVIDLFNNSYIYAKLRDRENHLLLSSPTHFSDKEMICPEGKRIVCFSMGSHVDRPWALSLSHIFFPTHVRTSSTLHSSSPSPYILKRNSIISELTIRWNEGYLIEKLGDYVISLHKANVPNLKFYPSKNFIFESIKFTEALKRLNHDHESWYYFRSISRINARKKRADFWGDYPSISNDLERGIIPIPEERWHSSILRMSSSRGLSLWLHYDVMSNFLMQIKGRKLVTLWPPSDLPFLYIQGSSSIADLHDHDAFPLLSLSHPVKVLLEPGDILFIPALWFHHVECIDDGWSLALNIFFKDLADEFYPKKDLFGNADPEVDPHLLPEPFKSFYTLKREMSNKAAL